jgi:alcohol dehydrogenase class IV
MIKQNIVVNSPSKVVFGFKSFEQLLEKLTKSNKKIAIIADSVFRKNRKTNSIMEISEPFYPSQGEPVLENVIELSRKVNKFNPEIIMALGGGSVIDTAKLVRAIIAEKMSVSNIMKNSFKESEIKLVAIPTTAGTGSEVTKFAVASVDATKNTFIGEELVPTEAYVDHSFLKTVPKNIIAITAIDALSHNIESLLSKVANPLSNAISKKGIRFSLESIMNVFSCKYTDKDLYKLSCSATLGGYAISSASVCEGHIFGHIIGSKLHVPHGVSVGIFLPSTVDMYLTRFPILRDRLLDCFDNVKEWFNIGKRIHKLLCDLGIYDSIQDIDILYEELENEYWFYGSDFLCRIEPTKDNWKELIERTSEYLKQR